MTQKFTDEQHLELVSIFKRARLAIHLYPEDADKIQETAWQEVKDFMDEVNKENDLTVEK